MAITVPTSSSGLWAWAPMLASVMNVADLDSFAVAPEWVMEQKLDGHRIVLRVHDGNVIALTRDARPYTKALPKTLGQGLPPGNWALDGEWVDGTLWVFDILEANGMVTPSTRLDRRREVLEALFALIDPPHTRLVPQAKTTGEKIALIERCRTEGAEGVMVKAVSSPYRPGMRSTSILKAKFVETADVVVLDVRDDGKDSVRLGAYNPVGSLVEVGRASLIGKEKNGAIQVGDVLECRYLYLGANGRMYQPTILRRRDDKLPAECSTSQFRHVNKEVLT